MSRLFTFQTNETNPTIDLYEGLDLKHEFPVGSLDRSFGVVLIDPKNFIYCVRCNDDKVLCPNGFYEFSDPKVAGLPTTSVEKCDCPCHNIPREGFFHCFSPCKCGK